MVLTIFIILSLIGLIEFFTPNYRGKKFFRIVGGVLLFCSVFWEVTYFVDRYNYETMFENIEDYNTDYIFKMATVFAYKYGWGFNEIYQSHILIMALFCTLFISRFTNRILFVILFLCIFRYVDYANQIRYYLGFFIALYSLYLIVMKKKYVFGFVLAFLAVLSHFSLVILFVIPLSYKFLTKIKAKSLLIFNVIILLLLGVIINVVTSFFPAYAKYFINPDGQSSFLGGLFDAVPAIIMALLVIKNHRNLKSNQLLNDDKQYIFLYTLSIFSFLLISYGMLFRIIIDRFVFSFFLVWICLLIYSLKYYPRLKLRLQKQTIFINCLFVILWFFYASYFVLGKSYYLNEALLMLGFDN